MDVWTWNEQEMEICKSWHTWSSEVNVEYLQRYLHLGMELDHLKSFTIPC